MWCTFIIGMITLRISFYFRILEMHLAHVNVQVEVGMDPLFPIRFPAESSRWNRECVLVSLFLAAARRRRHRCLVNWLCSEGQCAAPRPKPDSVDGLEFAIRLDLGG